METNTAKKSQSHSIQQSSRKGICDSPPWLVICFASGAFPGVIVAVLLHCSVCYNNWLVNAKHVSTTTSSRILQECSNQEVCDAVGYLQENDEHNSTGGLNQDEASRSWSERIVKECIVPTFRAQHFTAGQELLDSPPLDLWPWLSLGPQLKRIQKNALHHQMQAVCWRLSNEIRRVWLEGVLLVSVLGLYFCLSLAARFSESRSPPLPPPPSTASTSATSTSTTSTRLVQD